MSTTDVSSTGDEPIEPPGWSSRYQPMHDASVYDTLVDPTAENDAHGLIVRFTGEQKRVLELGCATGATTKILQERGSAVVAIEIDPDAAEVASQFAERMIVADLDVLDVDAALGDDTFDVIIAADVLEHLRDPAQLLRRVLPHLRPAGEVLVSVPNICHGDVRLAVMGGEFEYRPWGILDETHMRFFTRQSFARFLAENGLSVLEWERTTRPIGGTEISWKPVHDERLVDWVAAQEDADTYQFVVRTVVAEPGSHLADAIAMRDNAWVEIMRLRAAGAEHQLLADRFDLLQGDNEELADGVARLEAMVAELNGELQRRTDDKVAADVAAERSAAAAADQVSLLTAELEKLTHERDEFRAAFENLAGVQEELVAVRRSESFRLGRAILAPMVTSRRILRAWRRSKRPR